MFGFNVKHWNLSKKTELFVRLGFVAPRILKKINHARNILEYEYTLPSEAQVEEALDLAVLFVNSACRYLDLFIHEFSIGNFTERVDSFHFRKELTFRYDEENKFYIFRDWIDVTPENEGLGGG